MSNRRDLLKYLGFTTGVASRISFMTQDNKEQNDRNNPLINATRGRDECGINLDEVKEQLPEERLRKYAVELYEKLNEFAEKQNEECFGLPQIWSEEGIQLILSALRKVAFDKKEVASKSFRAGYARSTYDHSVKWFTDRPIPDTLENHLQTI